MRLIVRKSQLLRAVLSCASRKNVVLSGSRIKLLAGTNTDQSIPGDNAPSRTAHNGTYALPERVDEGAHIAGYALAGLSSGAALLRVMCGWFGDGWRWSSGFGCSRWGVLW